MKDNTFTIEVDNKEYTYNILKILNNTGLKYNYIIYTDNNDTFASRYKIVNDQVVLENVEEDYEWDYINKMFKGDEQ